MNEQTAAHLYLISKRKVSDNVAGLLEMLTILQGSDLKKVLEIYKKIVSKEIKVIQIEYAKEFNTAQKKELEALLKVKYSKNCIFLYVQKPELLGGLRLRMEDDLLDESILGKIEKLKI